MVPAGLWAELTEYHRGIYGDPSIGGDNPGAGGRVSARNFPAPVVTSAERATAHPSCMSDEFERRIGSALA